MDIILHLQGVGSGSSSFKKLACTSNQISGIIDFFQISTVKLSDLYNYVRTYMVILMFRMKFRKLCVICLILSGLD